MFKKLSAILIAGAFIFSLAIPAFAQEANQTEAKEEAAAKKAENAGNKICPVTGETIDEKTRATYEYEGKSYNFCCPMCIEEFKKDPQKYIKKVEQELQAESESQAKQGERGMEMMPESGASNQGIHEGHHH